MSIILVIGIVLILAALGWVAVDLIPLIPEPPYKSLLKLLIILAAILYIADRAGIF